MEPKKVLHFSDGELCIDEKNDTIVPEETLVSNNLDWMPWMKDMALNSSSRLLEVLDYMGESLASFFGITTPKYQFEINEYYRIMKLKEEKISELKDLEKAGWVPDPNKTQAVVTQAPHI